MNYKFCSKNKNLKKYHEMKERKRRKILKINKYV